MLETQVQILSSLLQSQSTMMARHIGQGHTGSTTSTTATENSAKIAKQAKEIKELRVKVASLDILSKNQEAKIKQLNDDLIKLRSMFIFLNLIFYQASHKPS